MKQLKLVYVFLIVSFLASCGSYPTSTVSQGGERPTVVFNTTSKTAQVILNGVEMGSAYRYRGKPHSLIIEEGAHTLQVVDNGQVLLEEKIFVSTGQTKTIDVAR